MNQIKYSDLVDVSKLQVLMENLSGVIGAANAVIDNDGDVIAHAGWQSACTDFHRVNAETCKRCIASDTSLARGMTEGKPYAVYRCLNGLVDAAAPIMVGGQHLASLFTGQFLTDAPDLEAFRRQARRFGFDEERYLAAIAKVPVVTPQRAEAVTRLYAQVAAMLAEGGRNIIEQRSAADDLARLNKSLEDAVIARTQALLISNANLAEAQSLARLGSWDLDIVGNRLTWSAEMYRIFGLTPKDFGASHEAFLDTIHPDDRDRVAAAYAASLEAGGRYDIEYRIVQKSTGRVVWGHARCVHVRDDAGKAVRSIGTVQDITERKHIETLAERERLRLRTILKTASDGIHILDGDGVLVEANDAFLSMLGYDAAAIGRLRVTDWEARNSWQEIKRDIDAMAQGQGPRVFETQHRRRDGGLVDVEISASGIEIDGRHYVYAAARDIGARKRTQAELERHRFRLEDMVAERTAQLRSMAIELTLTEERERHAIAEDLHDDLGQILATSKLKLTSLETLSPQAASGGGGLLAQIKEVEALIDRANRAVRSLSLQLSPPVLHQLGLVPALEWLAEEMFSQFGLSVVVRHDGGPVPLDQTTRSMLFRAVRELLINVHKHAGVDKADVSISVADDYLLVSVSDSGTGFDAGREIVPTASGGYGLFSVSERIRCFGGEMQIDSIPGDGTVAVLILPYASAANGEQTPVARSG